MSDNHKRLRTGQKPAPLLAWAREPDHPTKDIGRDDATVPLRLVLVRLAGLVVVVFLVATIPAALISLVRWLIGV